MEKHSNAVELTFHAGQTMFLKIAFIDLTFALSLAFKRVHEFKYKEIKGDLFSCPPSNSLAHCISEDCRMGKGIAALFKRKFGGVEDLIKQGKKPGDVAVLKRNQRFVYYLITKAKYWQKPNYLTLKLSLIAMKKHCVENKVTELSMPKIGTGLDRLEWFKVSQIIQEVFKDTSITVNIYSI